MIRQLEGRISVGCTFKGLVRCVAGQARITLAASVAAILLVGMLQVHASVASVTASQSELNSSWKTYWDQSDSFAPSTNFPHQACFEEAARQNNVPVTLALAISRGESNFDPRAISSANAIGMMQILWPITAKHLGITDRNLLFEPCVNIEAGVRYLREMLDRYNDNVHLTLAAYNYGPGRIEPDALQVPEGAAWYSGYIYNHLGYVLGTSAPQAQRQAPESYEDEKRLSLITFNDPDRAAAFVEFLRNRTPSVRLDWFDSRLGRWAVDMLYQDDAEKVASIAALEDNGFMVKP